MPTITYTPGGASDNCYVTLAQADAYYNDTLREEAWQTFGDAQREMALLQATAEIEQLGGAKLEETSPARALFWGEPYSTTAQALHFPRDSDVDDGTVFIPQAIQDGVCEQALWLLERDAEPPLIDREGLQAAGVTTLSIDGLSETYKPSGIPIGICPKTWMLVRPYVIRTGRLRP